MAKAYLPAGETMDAKGGKYMHYLPCPKCHGTGLSSKWINFYKFRQLLERSMCPHEHVASNGEPHFSAYEVLDDIETVRSDCGEVLN